jgi:sugar/nucleoside kinase (ribokinase family)
MKQAKVMAAGHICLDITPSFQTRAQNFDALIRPGSLTQVGSADIHTGGAVANTGMALSFFGVNTVLAAKIGKDAFGAIIKDIIAERHCAAHLIEDANEATSYSLVIAPPGIDRCFLHNPGANNSFCAADITDEMLSGVTHFHFGYPPQMRNMYLNNGTELASLFKRVKSRGITTSLDMAAVDANSEAGQADWQAILAATLPFVDYFVPSLEELCFMFRVDPPELSEEEPQTGPLTSLAEKLFALGAKTVLIKCGAAGMYYHSRDGHKHAFVKSYPVEHYVSATGAGDTSIAAFLAERLKGAGLERSVQVACAAGAACIGAYDALSGLKPLAELEREAGQYY